LVQHLLPPNLLKLFAARPPLPYVRPIDKDINVVKPKQLSGVANLLAQIKEENDAGLIDLGKAEIEAGAVTEEDSKFTLAEETRREIRREEKKKLRTEEFKAAVANCEP
jgi:U1 small nuclear ribonucleoprotein 70kDa